MCSKSDLIILAAAGLSLLISVAFWFGFIAESNRETALFVGLWVPSILAGGLYFKTLTTKK